MVLPPARSFCSPLSWMLLALSWGLTGRADTELNVPGHRLVWNDEFEAPSLDVGKWDVATGGQRLVSARQR